MEWNNRGGSSKMLIMLISCDELVYSIDIDASHVRGVIVRV
jgi:hypothetical protein